jgi:hypothetical protein
LIESSPSDASLPLAPRVPRASSTRIRERTLAHAFTPCRWTIDTKPSS